MAAKEEGINEVPCVLVGHLTEAQKKAYIIADNKMALDAGWDEELLKVEIEALSLEDFNLDLTGFDEVELSKLFDSDTDIKEDDFNVEEELQKPTMSKQGDVWLLGKHRLVCGDSTKEETYQLLMDGNKVTLVVTDPPYNVNYEGSAGKIKNDNMSQDKFYEFLFADFTQTEQVLETDGKINDHSKVSGIIKLGKSMLEISNDKLDKDAFLINTPIGIVDLKTGDLKEHDPKFYCTKMTKITP